MAEKSSNPGFSAEEKAAMKAYAAELKAQAKAKDKRDAGTKMVREAIEKLDGDDRRLAERFFELVSQHAPVLVPKTYYGMPGFANADDKMLVFFQPASKFKVTYSTIGFEQVANLGDSAYTPSSWRITEWTPAAEKEFLATLARAIS